MPIERLELNCSNGVLTESKVVGKILKMHPEILQVSMASYAPRPHGVESADNYRGYFPVATEKSTLSEGYWRTSSPQEKEIVAIGSTVDVCETRDCTHSYYEHKDIMSDVWDSWHDGVAKPFGAQKSFIFIDVETHGQPTLDVTKQVLKQFDYDWYLSDSGAGYHVIFDTLVKLGQMAAEYGKVITQFGEHLKKPSLVGWGTDLIKNAKNERRVESWCRDVLTNCGHADDPIHKSGKEVHILDLRQIAHSLQRVQGITKALKEGSSLPAYPYSDTGGAYLRISPKRNNSSPPVLVSQSVGGEQKDFYNPFANTHSNQKSLI